MDAKLRIPVFMLEE